MRKKSAGFTILELVVVLSIIAMLLSLSLSGLTSVRQRTVTRQAAEDLVSGMNSLRNSARNGTVFWTAAPASAGDVINATNKIDYYGILIQDNNVYRVSCQNTNGIAPTNPDNNITVNCDFGTTPVSLKNSVFSNVSYIDTKFAPFYYNDNCEMVLFSVGTGKGRFYATAFQTLPTGVQSNMNINNTGQDACSIGVTFNQGSLTGIRSVVRIFKYTNDIIVASS